MANFVLRNGWSACLLVACLYLVVLAPSCGASQAQGAYAAEADPRKYAYVIGISDVLAINVWKDPELSTETVVRPDGTITMPLVGDIAAKGKTPSQLKDDVKKALDKYLKLPAGNEVAVKVKAYNSYRFTVNGEVERPGMYTSTDWVRVADALALAGGPTRFANRRDIKVLRTDGKGNQMAYGIDFDLVASGKRPDMNFWIRPNDVIWVP